MTTDIAIRQYKIRQIHVKRRFTSGDAKMAKFKDFGTPNTDDLEPISFRLFGEDFNCRPQIPGKVMLDMAAKTADEENAAANAAVITDFFNVILMGDSLERFNALAEDPDRVVTIEQLMEIVSWLMEQYADRPTPRPED